MFKSVITSLGLLCSTLALAELSISEKMRPVVHSQVNPEMTRLPVPATPNKMKLPAFGQGLIGWGSGPEGAQARLDSITAADVHQMQIQGLTLEMVQAWQAFYTHESQRRQSDGALTCPINAKNRQPVVGTDDFLNRLCKSASLLLHW